MTELGDPHHILMFHSPHRLETAMILFHVEYKVYLRLRYLLLFLSDTNASHTDLCVFKFSLFLTNYTVLKESTVHVNSVRNVINLIT